MEYIGRVDFEPGSRRSRAPIPSILDLPLQLLIDIFSRLPIKSILYSRCVCKLWYHLLSGIEFTNVYSSQVPINLLLQATNFLHPNQHSKVLYSIDVQRTNPHPGLALNPQTSLRYIDYTYSRLVLKPKINLPDIDFGLVNSCDGLLCLYDFKTNDPIYVCNPILGQYITLPRVQSLTATCTSSVTCHGFGFSHENKQYKVMRIVQRVSLPKAVKHTIEVYTLGGEGSWRSIGEALRHFPSRLCFNVFVNGILHWDSNYGNDYCFFDFESEQFGLISGPENKESCTGYRCLGVLHDRLSVCYYNSTAEVEIWIMNDYGVKESWAKQFVISLVGVSIKGMDKPISCEPIKILDSGDILMLVGKCALVLYDAKLKCFRVQYYYGPTFETIAYTPTFLSLKEVTKGFLSLKKVARGEYVSRTFD